MITVSGPHGTGKSTYAKALAEALHLRYISAGEIFRNLAKQQNLTIEELSRRAAQDQTIDHMLDDRTKIEARRGGVVIDAQLGAWMTRELVDVKVLLTAADEVRFKRIAEREGVGLEEAQKQTEYRESIQRRRYKEYYGIDVEDLSIYDIKIATNLYPIEETTRIIIESVRNFLAQRRKTERPK